ncbi:MAG: DUF3352 domain-containing protein [Bacteroidia bacterium]|nr:DUF3352 domain-containing protein [Bacteroidia bacterium]
MKKLFRFLIFFLLLAVAAVAGYFFIDVDDEQYTLLSFVPSDFVYLVESDQPVGDWQELSDSKVWKSLKSNEFFADITESADYLDSLLASNQTVVDLVKLGNMVISAHMVSKEDYDFLIMVDLLGKGRKASKIKPLITELLESFDYQVSTENYINNTIYKLYDSAYDENMYLAFVGNILLFSYDGDLVKKGIRQSGEASILSDANFLAIHDEADASELYSIYLNYRTLGYLISSYTSEPSEMLTGLDEILTYSVWDLRLDDDHMQMDGFIRQNDSIPSYLTVFGKVGRGKVGAAAVLPGETAMFSSVGFEDFGALFQELMAQTERGSPKDYADLIKRKAQLEKLLKIDVEKDLFDWMTEEVVTAVVPVGDQYASLALMHFDEYDLVKERLDYVAGRIGKTMVKFEETEYRGFPIKYLELKGFFKLFFKKLFSKIEQPHYTFVDDYVVFGNDTTSLHLIIDSYLDGKVLAKTDGFPDFIDEFESRSNIFTYLQTETFYGYMSSSLDYEARRDLQKNRNDFVSFPHIGFQLYPSGDMYKTLLFASFQAVE